MKKECNLLSLSQHRNLNELGFPRICLICFFLQAMANFMTGIMGGRVSFNPSQMLLTSGATPAIEILSFCLADPGNAFLIPTPYYPG